MAQKKKASYHGFMLREMLIGSGIINGIINGVIFWLLHMGVTSVSLTAFVPDFILTTAIIAILLALLEPVLLKSGVAGGTTPMAGFDREDHMLYQFFGKNTVLDILYVTVAATCIGTFFPIGIAFALNITSFGLLGGCLFKGIACALCGMTTFYFIGGSYLMKAKENRIVFTQKAVTAAEGK